MYPLLVVPGLVVGGVPRKLPKGSKRVRLPETSVLASNSAPTLPRWWKSVKTYAVVQVLEKGQIHSPMRKASKGARLYALATAKTV